MPHTPGRVAPDTAAEPTVTEPVRPIRRKRGLRLTLLSAASAIVLLGGAAAASFAYVNHEVGSIPRIPVSFTAETTGTAGPVTVLLTGYQLGGSGMIMLLHLNADHQGGGVVSIPPQTEVQVAGHGRMQLSNALAVGGPSLVVRTVQSLTGVHINHYARVNFSTVAATIDALGGVGVDVPQAATAFGYQFKAGVEQVNGGEAMAYARQLNLTGAQRVRRQQALLRAILTKVASRRLLTNPVTTVKVLNAFTRMLTVDRSFTSTQLESLATEMGSLSPSAAAYVTAPVTAGTLEQPEASQLWAAIKQDSMIAFAQRYPSAVTPGAIG